MHYESFAAMHMICLVMLPGAPEGRQYFTPNYVENVFKFLLNYLQFVLMAKHLHANDQIFVLGV